MGGPRRRKPVEERRAELLELAIGLFAARAYDDVSTDDIAAEASISKGLLYHYFAGKRGLYVAAIREVAERLERVTQPDPELPFEAALRGSLRAFVDFVRDNRRLYEAMLRGGIGSDPEVVPILEHLREVSVERVLGRLGIIEPEMALRVAAYGWVGFVETACLGWPGPSVMAEESLVDLLQEGLAPVLARLSASGRKRRRT